MSVLRTGWDVGELVLGDVERGHRLLEELADDVELALEGRVTVSGRPRR
jgi:hypothetical protein